VIARIRRFHAPLEEAGFWCLLFVLIPPAASPPIYPVKPPIYPVLLLLAAVARTPASRITPSLPSPGPHPSTQ
jgi:hypothetical protein